MISSENEPGLSTGETTKKYGLADAIELKIMDAITARVFLTFIVCPILFQVSAAP